MKKSDLINVVNALQDNQHIVFVEKLDSGENNKRTMGCSKEKVLDIINNYFDDNLHGHVRDHVMTTIVSYRVEFSTSGV